MASILGVKVDNLTRKEAIERVGRMFQDGGQHIITTPNPEFIVAAQNDPEFRAILNRASLALPDGVGLLFAARVLGIPCTERIAGSDFVWDIMRLAAEKRYTVGLVGAKPGVAEKSAQIIMSRFHDCAIVKSMAEPDIAVLQRARPQILLVALGHGKQEKWIAEHLPEMPSVRIAMGVGGVFDFLAGRVRRSPRIFRALGLEWFWRLLREPQRLPRILRAIIVFPLLVVRAKFYTSNSH